MNVRTFIKNNGNFRKALLIWSKSNYDCYNVPIILKNKLKLEILKLEEYRYLYQTKGLNNTIEELFKNLVLEYILDQTHNNKNLNLYINTLREIKKKRHRCSLPHNHPNKLDDYHKCQSYKKDDRFQYCFKNCKWCIEEKRIILRI